MFRLRYAILSFAAVQRALHVSAFAGVRLSRDARGEKPAFKYAPPSEIRNICLGPDAVDLIPQLCAA